MDKTVFWVESRIVLGKGISLKWNKIDRVSLITCLPKKNNKMGKMGKMGKIGLNTCR